MSKNEVFDKIDVKKLNTTKVRYEVYIQRLENRIKINKLMMLEDTLDAMGCPKLKELHNKEFSYEGRNKEWLYL